MMQRKGAVSFVRRLDRQAWRVLAAVYLGLCGSLSRADDGSIFGRIWGMQTDVSIGVGAGVDQRYMGGRDFSPLLLGRSGR